MSERRRRSRSHVWILCSTSAAVCLCALHFESNPRVRACAYTPIEPAYQFSSHPELPLDPFARGQLGILRPDFARSYLAVAYRYLTDKPLTVTEQRGALALWNARMNHEGGDTEQWAWEALRLTIPGVDSESVMIQGGERIGGPEDSYVEYVPIASDAWIEATGTLKLLIAEYGIGSQAVRAWAANQDDVFEAGSGGAHSFDAPRILTQNAELRELSEYQYASALFYQERFDSAAAQFKKIARDVASPYQSLAVYMIGRCYLRKAVLPVNDPVGLRHAKAIFESIAKDPKEFRYRKSALSLIDYIQARLQPSMVRATRFAHLLEANSDSADFRSDLNEYTGALDKSLGLTVFYGSESNFDTIVYPVPDTMTDWILSFQDTSSRAWSHVLDEWNSHHNTLWLISLLSKAVPNDLSADAIAAAETVPATDPAWETIQYETIHTLIEEGKVEQARAVIDRTLNTTGISKSLRNDLLGLQMENVTAFDAYLRSSLRHPIGLVAESDMPLNPAQDTTEAVKQRDSMSFDQATVGIYNFRLPLELLDSAANDTVLPQYLRFDLLLSVWTRSVLLDDPAIGVLAARTIATEAPSIAGFMLTFADDTNPEHQRMDAIFTLLKNPSLQPIIYSGYGQLDRKGAWWWCNDVVGGNNLDLWADSVMADMFPAPRFLSSAQNELARQELSQLRRIGAAPTYLGRAAMYFANEFPNDPRTPEMLYRAVMASRYGCKEDSVKIDYSKEAFQLLHKRYPKSEWAKRAHYWF